MQLNKLTDGFELVSEPGEERRLGDLYQCLVDHGFIHMKASGVMEYNHFGFEQGELTPLPVTSFH
jgi:hypothetical protein